MLQTPEPRHNPRGDAPTPAEIQDLELFRRSPHPYLRHKDQICRHTPHASKPPSPRRPSDHTISDDDGRKRRKTTSQSPSESGTEADDEGYSFVKALPAPPLRPHKGLRDAAGEWASPLLTPTQIDDEGRKISEGYFDDVKKGLGRAGARVADDDGARAARLKYQKRRRNELVRRTTETALLAGISVLAVRGCGCWGELLGWHKGEWWRGVL